MNYTHCPNCGAEGMHDFSDDTWIKKRCLNCKVNFWEKKPEPETPDDSLTPMERGHRTMVKYREAASQGKARGVEGQNMLLTAQNQFLESIAESLLPAVGQNVTTNHITNIATADMEPLVPVPAKLAEEAQMLQPEEPRLPEIEGNPDEQGLQPEPIEAHIEYNPVTGEPIYVNPKPVREATPPGVEINPKTGAVISVNNSEPEHDWGDVPGQINATPDCYVMVTSNDGRIWEWTLREPSGSTIDPGSAFEEQQACVEDARRVYPDQVIRFGAENVQKVAAVAPATQEMVDSGIVPEPPQQTEVVENENGQPTFKVPSNTAVYIPQGNDESDSD